MQQIFLVLSLAFFLGFTSVAQVHIITSIAGVGFQADTGDGGPSVLAGINWPVNVALDKSGNVYIPEVQTFIRKIDTFGIIHTIAGNAASSILDNGVPSTAASVGQPWGMALDRNGNIYYADIQFKIVRKIDTNGLIFTVAGIYNDTGYSGDNGPATLARLKAPYNVSIDNSGNLYICDIGSNVIRKVNTSGIITTYAGNGTPGYNGDGGPATSAQFRGLYCTAFDLAGNMLVADGGNSVIRKIYSSSGIVVTIGGNGVYGFSGDGGPASAAKLYNPTGVTVDNYGNIYIADFTRIRKIDTFGTISTYAGNGLCCTFTGNGGLALNSELGQPEGLAIDRYNNLYIANGGGDRILKVTPNHIPLFVAGSNLATHLCENLSPLSLDSVLSITDKDVGQREVWSVQLPPSHGVLTGFPDTSVAFVGITRPHGLTYAPAFGFIGEDSFVVTVSDGFDSSFITIYVNIDSAPVLKPINGSDHLCIGDSVLLSDSISGGIWSCSNSAASINAQGELQGLYAGIDTVNYMLSSGNCRVAVSKVINIYPVVIPRLSIVTNPAVICAGTPITFTAFPVNGGPSPAFQWTINNSLRGTNNTYTFIPKQGDIITCILTSVAECAVPRTATCTDTLAVTDNQIPSVSISCLPGDSLCHGDKVMFAAKSLFGGVAPVYIWMKNGSVADSSEFYNYLPENGDVVYCKLLSNYACLTNDLVISNKIGLTVKTNCLIIHDGISPNGDGLNDLWVIEGLARYPENTVQVFDKWGDLIFENKNYGNNWGGLRANGDRLPSGTYYYLIKLNALNLDRANVITGTLLIKY